MTRNDECSITDDWTYKGLRTIFMENAWLRIGILVDRGSDIFEFRYKPLDVDPLLRLPKGIINPSTHFTQMRNTSNQFEDYYYGGWQEILPNSPGFNYRGAVLGQHGEVSLTPWKHAIVKDSGDEVAVKVWTEPLRLPLRIEKTLSLTKNDAKLTITENLINLGKTHLDIMWGHHIAFGLPFLNDGARIETNATTFSAEPSMPPNRRFKPDKEFAWPHGENIEGVADDARVIPNVEAKPYSDLCYLKGYTENAFYSLTSKTYGIDFNLGWDGALFKYLWLWQERHATKDFPWWGQCYTVALEPWTSPWTSNPQQAIENSDWLRIGAGEKIATKVTASISNP
jgi:galactose mutarotase-like enzyme